jgi:hypothetical protein
MAERRGSDRPGRKSSGSSALRPILEFQRSVQTGGRSIRRMAHARRSNARLSPSGSVASSVKASWALSPKKSHWYRLDFMSRQSAHCILTSGDNPTHCTCLSRLLRRALQNGAVDSLGALGASGVPWCQGMPVVKSPSKSLIRVVLIRLTL